jgi:MarR family transcriptional regulator, transcriptional regulator for hemolysin
VAITGLAQVGVLHQPCRVRLAGSAKQEIQKGLPMINSRQLEEQFGRALPLLARLYRRRMDEALKGYGLTKTAALPLQFLAQAESGVRHRALAALMNIEGPTLVRLVDQLVAAGYVERADDDKDGRGRIVRLTTSGHVVNERMAACLAEARSIFLQGVNEQDLGTAVRVLDQVLQNTLARRASPGLPTTC